MFTSATLAAMALTSSGSWAAYGAYPPPVAPYTTQLLPRDWVVVPMIFPVLRAKPSPNTYNQPRGRYRHTGIDIRADKMTPIVAPFSGHLGLKKHSFWIYGDNGWKCLATHLNDDTPGSNDGRNNLDVMFAANLRHGDRVVAGQLIGYVGDSGNATGPHLHFELHGPKGIRNPWPSLRRAQIITRPRTPVDKQISPPKAGEERWEIVLRKFDPNQRVLFGVRVAKQFPGGRVIADSSPQFVRLKLTKFANGQFERLDWPWDRAGAVYVKFTDGRWWVVRAEPPRG